MKPNDGRVGPPYRNDNGRADTHERIAATSAIFAVSNSVTDIVQKRPPSPNEIYGIEYTTRYFLGLFDARGKTLFTHQGHFSMGGRGCLMSQ